MVETKALQALVEGKLAAGVVCSPDLGHDKDVLALDAGVEGGLEALANLVLVSVAVGAINERVAVLEGVFDGSLDLAGLGLPGAEANGGDVLAGVELEGGGGHCERLGG